MISSALALVKGEGGEIMKVKIKKAVLISALVASVTVLSGCGASWERQKKNWDSEFSGGLNREIIVYSATGAEVWRFTGKFDINFSEGRILFDDENNMRHTVYFQNGTVIVNEILADN